jgi:hypothetical protein
MMEEKTQTLKGKKLQLSHTTHPDNLTELLLSLRQVERGFLTSEILHDPLLLPDIQKAVERIAHARALKQRVMIFGDYDVDGISSTAALFLYLRDELGMDVSYRLPHRVHDGYGIKSYHMDEIAKTGTKLIITVDCGTKDIWPIEHAYSLGMDVIVTDHHSVLRFCQNVSLSSILSGQIHCILFEDCPVLVSYGSVFMHCLTIFFLIKLKHCSRNMSI